MGNSLRKDVELSVIKLRIKKNNDKSKINVEKLLSLYRKLTEENKKNISRYIDDSIIIYELMNKIKYFMYKKNVSVEDLTLKRIEKIKDIELIKKLDDDDKDYFVERAFLYTKYKKQEDEKGCGTRNTKKNPAYTKDELVNIVVDKWDIFNKTTAKKKTLAELCNFIDLNTPFDFKKNEEQKDSNVPKGKEQGKDKIDINDINDINNITLDNLPDKPCKQRNTKKNPAYTKDELVNIISKYKTNFGLNKTQILKLTKDKMCDLLFDKKDEKNVEKNKEEKKEEKKFDGDEYIEKLVKNIENKERKKYEEFLKNDKLRLENEANLKKERKKLYGLIEEEKEFEEEKEIYDNKKHEKSLREQFVDMFGEEFEEEYEREEKLRVEEEERRKKENEQIRLEEERRKKEKERLRLEEEQLKNSKGECYSPINKNIKLKEHQIRVAKHMLKHRGLIAIHGTGTGKTLTAVASMNCILKNFPNMEIIIVTPTSLIGNFKKELTKFGLNINSQLLRDKIKFFTFTQFMLDILKEKNLNYCKNKFLIIDEAHNLRNVEAGKLKKAGKKALTLMQCAKHASKVLLLTATPMKNRISDIIPLISMVDGKDIDHIDTSTENALKKTFSCKISVVLPDKQQDENYPKRINVPISETSFIMPYDYYTEYYELENELKEKLDMYTTTKNIFYNLVRRMSLSLDKENSPKVQWTFNFLKNEVRNNRKTVVYTAWKESGVDYVRKLLDKEKIPYGIITGDITPKNRDFYKDLFNKGEIKILIVTKAGGEGLDLTETRNVILMEQNWNSSEDEQIIGRAIRYNSHKNLPPNERNVKVYRLMMYKPENLIPGDKEPRGIDQILYSISYDKKEPVINEFLEMITPFSIENVNCECDGPQCSRFSGMSESEFFELITHKKKTKPKPKKQQQNYEAPDGKTFLVNPIEYLKNKINKFID